MPGQASGPERVTTRAHRARGILLTAVLVGAVAAAVLVAATGDPGNVTGGDDRRAAELAELVELAEVRTETSAPRVDPAGAPTAPASAPIDASGIDGPPATAIAALDAVPSTGGTTDLVRRYFGSLTVEAIVIVQCESGFDPNALNTNTDGTQDHGLFQINDVHTRSFEAVTGQSWAERYDPELNTAFAAWLHGHAGGWGPWRCNRLLEQFDEPAP